MGIGSLFYNAFEENRSNMKSIEVGDIYCIVISVMKEGVQVETNILITCVAAVCGIVFGYLTLQARVKGESKQSGIEVGQLKADIEYIKRSSDTTLLELRCLNKTVNNHADRLARVEESTKQAHLRINELREELGKDVPCKI